MWEHTGHLVMMQNLFPMRSFVNLLGSMDMIDIETVAEKDCCKNFDWGQWFELGKNICKKKQKMFLMTD